MSDVVDAGIPRFNQGCVAVLTGTAFVVQWWPLVGAVALVLGITWLGGPRYGLFTQIYVRVVRPRRHGDIVTEDAAPPRFAQLLGATLLTVATVLLASGLESAGWILTLVVTALATLAATTRVCVGCRLYDRLAG